jgi:hypothetical protein
MPEYSVGLEPWSDGLWAEMKPHAEAHFREVDGGVEPNRPFKLDERLMGVIAQAGSLKVVIARKAGFLVGYFTWNLMLDIESEGLLIAQQGAWYVAPGHPRVAVEMFDASVAAFKALGVKCLFPHHRTQGRGAQIGKFFKRRGAKHIQQTYSLWIGG